MANEKTQPITGTPTVAELLAQIAATEAENAAMRGQIAAHDKANPLKLKVSEKGGVSIYGLGRFPVTLYKEQWKRLLAYAATIVAFLDANDALLKSKGDAAKTPAAKTPDTIASLQAEMAALQAKMAANG